MRTIAIFVELDEELLEILDEIAMTFMCFMDLLEDCLTITARQEDMASIEKKLAKFV